MMCDMVLAGGRAASHCGRPAGKKPRKPKKLPKKPEKPRKLPSSVIWLYLDNVKRRAPDKFRAACDRLRLSHKPGAGGGGD